MVILISIYTIINFINIDYIIAYRNVNRYLKKEDIDIYYLMNNHTDNIPVLIDLYNETDDLKIKQTLKNYFSSSINEYLICRIRKRRIFSINDCFIYKFNYRFSIKKYREETR